MDKASILYLHSFLRYQAKCVVMFLFRQLMTPQTLRFIFHQPLQQWLTKRKRGEIENICHMKISDRLETTNFVLKSKSFSTMELFDLNMTVLQIISNLKILTRKQVNSYFKLIVILHIIYRYKTGIIFHPNP